MTKSTGNYILVFGDSLFDCILKASGVVQGVVYQGKPADIPYSLAHSIATLSPDFNFGKMSFFKYRKKDGSFTEDPNEAVASMFPSGMQQPYLVIWHFDFSYQGKRIF